MASDTEETPEERKTYHWKVRPSVAAELAMYARKNGVLMCFALEQAILSLAKRKS